MIAALLERPEAAHCLLMDGLAVDSAARGRGVGTRLLGAIEIHARALGKTGIRLDVLDTNPGARRLYERCGFIVEPPAWTPYDALFPALKSVTMRKSMM